MKPLSHHEILGWIEPFARRGLQADLAASDRLAGRLAFRPRVAAPSGAAPSAGGEDSAAATPLASLAGSAVRLQLQRLEHGGFRLTRELMLPGGLVATLTVQGADVARLLEDLEAVPPARQQMRGAGYEVALDHELESGSGAPGARLRLVQASAQFDGFRLHLDVSGDAKGMPGKVELQATPARDVAVPEDLLAVLGWNWTRLTAFGDAWRGELRLRGAGLARGQRAEARLEAAVPHLAATFAAPPARFHERHLAARWRVTLRRAVPLLVSLALIAGAAAVPKLGIDQDAALRMVLFNVPPLLLIAMFCLPEMPRIEIPPLPRRPAAASWREPGA